MESALWLFECFSESFRDYSGPLEITWSLERAFRGYSGLLEGTWGFVGVLGMAGSSEHRARKANPHGRELGAPEPGILGMAYVLPVETFGSFYSERLFAVEP